MGHIQHQVTRALWAVLLAPVFCFGQGQSVGAVAFSGAAGANVAASSMTNTAGDLLWSWAWVRCTSTNPNSTPAFSINGGTANKDSNGNTWNLSIDSQYTFTSTKVALYFFWTLAPIAGGANIVTYKNATADCQIDGIQMEYGPLTYWNGPPSYSYRVNVNFMPFGTFENNTSFPINANATYVAPTNPSNNLLQACAIHEGASTGTWSGSTGLSLVLSESSTAFQMVCYDGTATTVGAGGPSSIQISNTSGTVTRAVGIWEIFNRTPSPGAVALLPTATH